MKHKIKTAHTPDQIKWHLQNNVMPKLSDKAINGILETVVDFNLGKLGFESEIVENSCVTVQQMFEDLKIEIK